MYGNIEIKDYLYYEDLIADLRDKAGVTSIIDDVQQTRISQRRKLFSYLDSNGNLMFLASDYSREFMDIANQVYFMATGVDEFIWEEQLSECINEINWMIKKLEILRDISIFDADRLNIYITDETKKYIYMNSNEFINCGNLRIRVGDIYVDGYYKQIGSVNNKKKLHLKRNKC